jgi:hypothetical protein
MHHGGLVERAADKENFHIDLNYDITETLGKNGLNPLLIKQR